MPKRDDRKSKKSQTKNCSSKSVEDVQDCSTPGKRCK